jgi:hypothetical protein
MSEVKCVGCESTFDTDSGDGGRWSELRGAEYCWGCFESDIESASVVTVYKPGKEEDRYLIGSNWIVDGEYYEELPREQWARFNRTYTRTDAWRGYFVTTLEGWHEVAEGVNLWGEGSKIDGIAEKIKYAWEAELLPFDVAFAVDRTSNLFASGVSIFVPQHRVKDFEDLLLSLEPYSCSKCGIAYVPEDCVPPVKVGDELICTNCVEGVDPHAE